MSHAGRQRYLEELSSALFHFILPLLPTPEELNTKQQVRVLIEKLIRTVEPNCRLLRFGSTANGFSLRNSDMDLCVLLDGEEPRPKSAELVTLIGALLERETNFAVKALPKAYVPIIKLSLAPSPGLPFGIACDIGFENRLALENTRLLLTYATVDPARVRTMVLFLKVWSKRRKINSPYRGTLSSYGFTLLVLFFLIHIQNPPVLPNLQSIPPVRPTTKEETELDGHNIWFFDDTELLHKVWQSANMQSVGELLIDFFRFYCNVFAFNTDIVSIRAGLLTKESKQWTTDSDVGGPNEMARDRNRLCIEDPFETSYNVARTVTKDGLYTIRGEFMRASRILTSRPDRAVNALASLCEERDEDLMRAPRSRSPTRGGRLPYNVAPGSFRDPISPPQKYNHPPPSTSTYQVSRSVSASGPMPASSANSRRQWSNRVASNYSPVVSPKNGTVPLPNHVVGNPQGLMLDHSHHTTTSTLPHSSNSPFAVVHPDPVRGRDPSARLLSQARGEVTPPASSSPGASGSLNGAGIWMGDVHSSDDLPVPSSRSSSARGRNRVSELQSEFGVASSLNGEAGSSSRLAGSQLAPGSGSSSSSMSRRAVSTPPPMLSHHYSGYEASCGPRGPATADLPGPSPLHVLGTSSQLKTSCSSSSLNTSHTPFAPFGNGHPPTPSYLSPSLLLSPTGPHSEPVNVPPLSTSSRAPGAANYPRFQSDDSLHAQPRSTSRPPGDRNAPSLEDDIVTALDRVELADKTGPVVGRGEVGDSTPSSAAVTAPGGALNVEETRGRR